MEPLNHSPRRLASPRLASLRLRRLPRHSCPARRPARPPPIASCGGCQSPQCARWSLRWGRECFVARGVEELSRGTFSADREETSGAGVAKKRSIRQVRGGRKGVCALFFCLPPAASTPTPTHFPPAPGKRAELPEPQSVVL